MAQSGKAVELHEASAQHGVYRRDFVYDYDDLWTRKERFELTEGKLPPLHIVFAPVR